MTTGQVLYLVLAAFTASAVFVCLLSVAAYERFGSSNPAVQARRQGRNASVVHEVMSKLDKAA